MWTALRLDSDGRVIRRVLKGDRDAFGVLVERYFGAVRAVALANGGRYDDVDDIAQETFLKAYSALPELRERNKFGGWIVSIARNTARRTAQRRIREVEVLEAARANQSEAVEPPIESEELRALLRHHADKLDEPHRETILLYYFAGERTPDIARMLGVSNAAVRKRLQRGREALGESMFAALEGRRPNHDETASAKRSVLGAVIAAPPAWEQFGWGGQVATVSFAVKGMVGVVGAAIVVTAAVAVWPPANDADPPSTNGTTPIQIAQNDAEPATSSGTNGEAESDTPGSVMDVVGSLVRQEQVDSSAGALGQIRGLVQSADGEPVPGAAVHVEHVTWADHEQAPDETDVWTAETGSDGTFVFAKLPLGSYGIKASKENELAVDDTYLSLARPNDFVLMELQAGLPLSGVVTNEDGEAVDGAVLFVHSNKDVNRGRPIVGASSTVTRVSSDNDGRFRFNGLWEGEWRLLVKAEGYAPEITEALTAGRDDVEIVLGRGGSVSGQVLLADTQAPAANKSLLFRSGLDRVMPRVTTDSEGRFRLEGLREGNYQSIVDDTVLAVVPDSGAFQIAPKETTEGVVVLLAEGGAAHGRVYDTESKEGLAGVTLTAEPRGALGVERETTSDEEGKYELAGLGAGDYMIYPEPPKGFRQPFGSYQSDRTTAIALDGVPALRDLDLEPSADISGRVVNAAGEPVGGARIGLGGGANTYVGTSTYSEPDGYFEFLQMPRTSDLWLTTRKGELVSEAMELETVGAQLTGLKLVVRPGARIAGRVVDKEGTPVAGASVSAALLGSRNGGGGDEADTRGYFELGPLAAGRYLLIAERDDRPGTIYGERDIRPKIEVEFGEHISDYVLVLEEGAIIAGRVMDSEGEPIEGATVHGPTRTETAADGSFEVTGLFAEDGQITVSKAGYRHKSISRIPAGKVDLVVVLHKGATIRGAIRDSETNVPLTQAELGVIDLGGERFEWQSSVLSWELKNYSLVEGAFELENVETGSVHLVVQAPGYELFEQALKLEPGELVDDIQVMLEPRESLTVEVVDQSGIPVTGADVFIGAVSVSRHTRPEHKAGVTNANGIVTIAAPPPHDVTISAYHSNWSPGSARVSDVTGDKLQIALQPNCVITGTVLYSGELAQVVNVRYMTEDENEYVEHWHGQTESDGTFHLNNIPPGAGQIQVLRHYEDETGSGGFVFPVTVKENEENFVELQVPHGTGTIQGTVSVSGTEVTNGRCIATQQFPHGEVIQYGYIQTEDSTYTIRGLQPGPAEIDVWLRTLSGETFQQTFTVQVGIEPTTRDFAF